MKINKIILPLLFGTMLVACSPRVDDVFDDTAMVRLEKRRADLKNQFINAPNGWVMQYFAQSDPTSSDSVKHRGYTFLMQFWNDGTVTIGAKMNGKYNTETSMWDVISDNSSVLTFNTFNKIFHYYSNPDPELGLWGADGEGVGGDYEFMVLEYNGNENYQLLKGKKRSCYIRMYPLASGVDWEEYLGKLDAMDKYIFAEPFPLDLFGGNRHLTLYNGHTHEFRAFNYGVDTLGGGAYYGMIITENGLRLHDDDMLGIPVQRAEFRLNANKTRLVSVLNPNVYITIDGVSILASASSVWRFPNGINAAIDAAEQKVNDSISIKVPNSYIASYGWKKADDGRYELYIYYSLRGKAATNYDIYYFTAKQAGNHSLTLTYDSPSPNRSNLKGYGAEDVVRLFNGTYEIELTQPFKPSAGVTATRNTGDVTLVMVH